MYSRHFCSDVFTSLISLVPLTTGPSLVHGLCSVSQTGSVWVPHCSLADPFIESNKP